MKMRSLINLSTAAVMAVAVSSAQAAEWFVGGNVGYGIADTEVSSGLSNNDNPVKFGIQGGVYLNDNIRTYAVYTYGNDDGGNTELTQQQFLISADYLFGTGDIKPFVGLSLGAQQSEFEVKGANGFKHDDTDFAYGGQLGVQYNVQSWDMEVGYRQVWYKNEVSQNGQRLKDESDGNFYASVGYRF